MHESYMKWWVLLAAALPAVLTPAVELALNRSTERTDPAALLGGLFLLTALAIVVWIIFRPGLKTIGLAVGSPGAWTISLGYVLAVNSGLLLLAWTAGEVQFASTEMQEMFRTIGVIFTMTFLVVLLTEEGYFRGVLWGACDRCELGPAQTYWTTSFAFAAWHIYLPFVEPEFAIATWQIPIYLVNVILISFAWGWLRLATGSLWLCCFVHAVWNALVYSVFGAGVATGFSNIESVWIFGPERGCLGIIANGAALWLLSRLVRSPSNNHRRGIISTGDA